MSRIRLMAMMVVVTILLCLAASAAVAVELTFTATSEEVTVDYDFLDGRCRWTIDLWNSGLQQRMYQGQKQVWVELVYLNGSGSANGVWNQGNPPKPRSGTAFPSAYIWNLDTSVGRLDIINPRHRDFDPGKWISSTMICEARPDHSMYPGFEATSSDIEINEVLVLSS